MIVASKTAFTLQWTLVDQSTGASINTAAMVATLYQQRSAIDPVGTPGTPVVPINNVTLVYVPSSLGVYQAAIPATLDPTPATDGTYPTFTLVIDANVSAVPVYHHEEPFQVVKAVEANFQDLTTVSAVKSELNIAQSNVSVDFELQDYITSWSEAVLNQTGIKSFTRPQMMIELRDGNGNAQIFTRMRPIINVVSVTISGVAVPAAGDWPSSGYYVSDDQKSIKLRNVTLAPASGSYPTYGRQGPAFGFIYGQGNVTLKYWAGYINVPTDLEIASRKMVALYYGRKQTRDLKSKGLTSGGTNATTTYRDWDAPPEVCRVIDYYSRTAII